MSKVNYYEYLKSEAWQEKRMQTFKRDGFRCVKCGAEKNLRCHHITYERLGNEEASDLVTLCDDCHARLHNIHKAILSPDWWIELYRIKSTHIWTEEEAEAKRKRLSELFDYKTIRRSR